MGKRWRRKRRDKRKPMIGLVHADRAREAADLPPVEGTVELPPGMTVVEVPIVEELRELQRIATARRDAELDDLEPRIRELVSRVGEESVKAATELMVYGRRLVRLDLRDRDSRVSIALIRRALDLERLADRPTPDVVLVTAAAGSRIDDEARLRHGLIPPVLRVWGATLEREGEL